MANKWLREIETKEHCLKNKHLKNLKALPDRMHLMDKLPKRSRAAEVGVHIGKYTRKILDINNPKTLYLVDHWEDIDDRFNHRTNRFEKIKSVFKDELESGQVVAKKGYSGKILRQFADNSLIWVYLDSFHSYEQLKKELMISADKVKNNGYIAGHDYTDGDEGSGYKYGVKRAVREFCVEHDYEFKYLTFDKDNKPSYALQKI